MKYAVIFCKPSFYNVLVPVQCISVYLDTSCSCSIFVIFMLSSKPFEAPKITESDE